MKVAIIHEDINAGGGAEAVLANTLQALQHNHDVTLFTVTEYDFDALNDYHGTDVSPDLISVSNPLPASVDNVLRAIEQLTIRTLPITKLKSIKSSVMKRCLSNGGTEHHLYFCTQNEFFTESPAINYVHFPYLSAKAEEEYLHSGGIESIGRKIQSFIEGRKSEFGDQTTLVTNSAWTANVIEEVYDSDPMVIHPPIDTTGFDPEEWDTREGGFVAVGRVVPEKRHDEMIGVLDSLVERGIDTHLHIIGDLHETKFCETIRTMASNRPYVHIEEDISREKLCSLLESHKFGLHAMEREHFGMVVAEMRAAGMLPFAHRSGGQVELVNDVPDLLYSSFDELIETLSALLRDEETQRRLHTRLTSEEPTYTADQFRDQIRTLVERKGAGIAAGTSDPSSER